MATQTTVASGLLSGLPLARKFTVLGLIATVLVAIPFGLYVQETQRDFSAAQRRAEGVTSLTALFLAVKTTQAHRDLATVFLSGDKDSANRLPAAEKEAIDAMMAMDTLVKRAVDDPSLAQEWQNTAQGWQNLEQQLINRQVSESQSFKRHAELVRSYFQVLARMAAYFGMRSDREVEAALLQAVLDDAPYSLEALFRLRGEGRAFLEDKQASSTERARLAMLLDIAQARFHDGARSLRKVFSARPDIQTTLEPLLAELDKRQEAAFKLTQKEIIDAPTLGYSHLDYRAAYTAAIDSQFGLIRQVLTVLDAALQQQVSGLRTQQLQASFGILALFGLGSFIAYRIVRGVTVPIGYLVNVMNRLAGGDHTVRAHLDSADEIGMLGRQFDLMIDQREAISAQIQRENEALNNSVVVLLQAVARLAQRDLTVKVPVAEDVTGLVADALNLLSYETAKVLEQVTDIAHNVAQVSRQVKSQADTVIQVAAEEKQEVQQAAAELDDASEAMQDIARLARTCNEVAEQAIRNTDKAQEAVLDTVQGIGTIRDTIRETEKRIKRLGERSQEIGGVVNLINGIAERTHILALNASMHAASAGEAGRGFAVVASEVRKLAENAREATSRISSLVNNIQVETADTVTTMNEAISQVVRGTALAQQAGGEMRQTRETTADLVNLVQRIANSSTDQAKTTLRLRERAAQIQRSSEHTYQQLRDQGQQTERLVDFSGGLVDSVGVFVLPKAQGAAA